MSNAVEVEVEALEMKILDFGGRGEGGVEKTMRA
jgi:hypothetical protein